MALLSIQTIGITGLAKSLVAAAAGGDSFPNDGHVNFVVKNGGASAITVTINSQTLCNHGFDHDIAQSVAAGEERIFPNLDPLRFNDANGNVIVTYSAATSVTVGVLR